MAADTSSKMLVNMPICRRARSTRDWVKMLSWSACVMADTFDLIIELDGLELPVR